MVLTVVWREGRRVRREGGGELVGWGDECG